MASKTTQIARASHEDNRSLRVIQLLSAIFLPASLVSGIFGMGFFNTSPGLNGESVFTISNNWWLYIAVSIPLTIVIILFMGGCKLANTRRGCEESAQDLEYGEDFKQK